jgi:predicted glycogen debranching enzyme
MNDYPGMETVIERPLVHFGREIAGDLEPALRREWLATNGIGGYASGTVAGPNTRRYHGLLVAALAPPAERTVLVGGLVEWATCAGKRYPLSAHEYGGTTIDPQGYRHLESFRLEGMMPVWVFQLGDTLLERRIFMPHGANTTYVSYRLLRGSGAVELEVTPLVTYRDFHTLSHGQDWAPGVETMPRGATVHAFDGATSFYLLARDGAFVPTREWYWNFSHREETGRGLDDRSDLFAAGRFTASVATSSPWALVLSTSPDADLDADRAREQELNRQRALLRVAGVLDLPPAIQQLTLAADQFIVDRLAPDEPSGYGTTVIAGYHWFADWGRDTMISLPGLTLATGRSEDAADILRTFARYVQDGLLPNNFPDHPGVDPGYNTADASLWYLIAVHAYAEATGDQRLVDYLLPTLRAIVDAHIRGTRYQISVDSADGLLRAGEPGVQLTWMDAKVGDWVVTPRVGKPVEINALWYNALRILSSFLRDRGDAAGSYEALADQVLTSFRARFIREGQEHLLDVVDGPEGDENRVRPNQIFAVSLPFPLLAGDQARAVVDVVGRELLTSLGLRSLAPSDKAYRGDYGGDQLRRDGSYHQGPVWTWLIGAYVEAHYRVYGDADAALSFLRPFEHHLADAGLGSVSEILEGDTPHLPRGCIAQAWGVAEVLRAWRKLPESSIAAGDVGRMTLPDILQRDSLASDGAKVNRLHLVTRYT